VARLASAGKALLDSVGRLKSRTARTDEDSRQKIAAFEPKGLVVLGARPILTLTRPCARAPGSHGEANWGPRSWSRGASSPTFGARPQGALTIICSIAYDRREGWTTFRAGI